MMLMHGTGKQSVYESLYGLVNAVHNTNTFSFNVSFVSFHIDFSQSSVSFLTIHILRKMEESFLHLKINCALPRVLNKKSGAGFDKVIIALDGMLVWTKQSPKHECKQLKIGGRSLHCYRKDKFGYLLLVGCDDMCCL